MNEQEVQQFWDGQPCGSNLVGGLGDIDEAFFDKYDKFRYGKEPHILDILDGLNLSGLKVLEIGLGVGADSEQIIRRGARWTGMDLTHRSVEVVGKRMKVRGLDYDQVVQGSALEMPFEDNSFDVVYSFGVLHHIPDIRSAQAEIARVLKPSGRLAMMLYAKWSINYLLSIGLLRRAGLAAMVLGGIEGSGKTADHVRIAKQEGLRNYLRMNRFIHANTDGPESPYSKVYGITEVKEDFTSFDLVSSRKYFPQAPPLPVHKFRGGRLWGWHLMAYMTPKV